VLKTLQNIDYKGVICKILRNKELGGQISRFQSFKVSKVESGQIKKGVGVKPHPFLIFFFDPISILSI
jgi:hypothetical protein